MSAAAMVELVRIIQGGLDSTLWLLNNADKHGTQQWEEFYESVREDRHKAVDALAALRARVDAADKLAAQTKHLLLLKDGPRDAIYRDHKSSAWINVREALAAYEETAK